MDLNRTRSQAPDSVRTEPTAVSSRWAIFLVFLRLGLTSFGGPIAHLGYFREEFVARRQWLSERGYADLVALCQVLPGPTSSQVGMAIGLTRGGLGGALAAWLGFTLPSAVLLVGFAAALTAWGSGVPTGLLHGLKLVAVAVIAQAVQGMARTLCADAPRVTIAAATTTAVLLWPAPYVPLAAMALAGLVGVGLFRAAGPIADEWLPVSIRRRAGAGLLGLFLALLLGMPFLLEAWPNHVLEVVNAFYRAGSLVFGGGHVVLAMLQPAVVGPGWVSNDTFLAGYGATQAVPGPLFTFAAFLGASLGGSPSGGVGALLCLAAIFLPSALLVFGALPFWAALRGSRQAQAALAGVNAAVVGLLLAALYRPVWTSTVAGPADFCVVVAALVALIGWRLPPWIVVLCCGGAGWLLLA